MANPDHRARLKDIADVIYAVMLNGKRGSSSQNN